jgi:hypothetical protein
VEYPLIPLSPRSVHGSTISRGKQCIGESIVTSNEGPIINIARIGNLANSMMQYMVAIAIAQRVPECRISNIQMPEWGNSYEFLPGGEKRSVVLGGHKLDLDAIAARLREGSIQRVEFRAYAARMQNFPDLETCRDLFRIDSDVRGFGKDALVINIRGREILDGHHPEYTLIPVSFYRSLVETTGLRPVFMGQTGPNRYADALRSAFPSAEWLDSGGALHDFELIRRSKNVVISVSTFSWLAGWLGTADRVVLPMTGFFNPFQTTRADLLPLDDNRYEFHLFPVNYAVPVQHVEALHRTLITYGDTWIATCLGGLWRASPDFLAESRDIGRNSTRLSI